MRYEDASSSFSNSAAGPDARDDADTLAAGSRGPATGNAVTGAGTITGQAGADVVGDAPGHIVALSGAGGSDKASGNESLEAAGRFGTLTMEANGSYSYRPNGPAPESARDVFRYTLSDESGARDTATLTIEIGKTVQVQANAQQIIPGPDGAVTLPPGVELSDVHVVGRNLVIDMPDGTQMIIVDGAVFVPQLILGGVEVPATNLAALLIDSEPRPAAGPTQSSGGNFGLPPGPLDPGVPLGDLIPPTELTYVPPEFEEVGQVEDEEPEILIIPDGQPGAVNATDQVFEAGLPAREGEPEGSGEEAAAGVDGDTREATLGVISFDDGDGLSSITINGVAITSVGQTFAGSQGTLTITSIDLANGQIGYSYVLTDNTDPGGDNISDVFEVVVTDTDGDTATGSLTIAIVDDEPIARNDTDAVTTAQPTTIGNVITGADTTSGAAGRDTVGADNATLTAVSGAGGSDSSFNESGNLVVTGSLGTLTIKADGSYSYTANNNSPGGNDVFTYTLTDGDGDIKTATLTITVPADLQPTVSVPTSGASTIVDEKGLPERNDGEPEGSGEEAAPGANGDPSETTTGTITFTPGDVPATVTIDGLGAGGPVTITGAGQTINGQYGTLTITSYNAAAGTIGYSYTLLDNTSGNNTEDNFSVVVTDVDNDIASATLSIDIIDDVPTARPDTDTVPSGTYGPAIGNVITDAEGDGGKDTVGADDAVVVGVAKGDTDANLDSPTTVGVVIQGDYGKLTLNADGTYSYVRDAGTPGGVTDVFTYTLKDGDGDLSSTTLTIAIENRTVTVGQNPVVLTDDDAVVGAGGNAGGPEDDADADNLTGTLSGSGGDGPLTFDLLTTGAPDGFTYVDGPDGSVLVQQVQDGETVTVLTITVNAATGGYTVTQNAPILHPTLDGEEGDDTENNVSFTINYTVTDQDDDVDDGTLTINVDDDSPVVTASLNREGAVTVDESGPTGTSTIEFTGDEGDDPDVDGAGPIGRAVGTAAVVNASVLFGADGPLTDDLTYALQLGSTDTPLTLTDGSAIQLQLIDGVVVGVVTEGDHAGDAAFAIAIDPTTGIATVELYLSLDHPDATNPNDSLPLGPNTVSVVVSATDADGDTDDSAPVDISGQFNFLDDGPTANGVINAGGAVTVDESGPTNASTIEFTGDEGDDLDVDGTGPIGRAVGGAAVVNASALFGADGENPTEDFTYALQLGSTDTPLTLTDGSAIQLQLIDGVIVGVVTEGPHIGDAAFAIAINPDTGVATVELYLSLDHPDATNPNDSLPLGPNTVSVVVTATDGDGDTDASAPVDISAQFSFLDDGPTAGGTLNGQGAVTVDESGPTSASTIEFTGDEGDDPDVAGTGPIGRAVGGTAVVTATAAFGADGPAEDNEFSYALALGSSDTPLTLTDGSAIQLQLIDGVVVGVVTEGDHAGDAAFAIAINPDTGVATVELYLSLDHPDINDPNDSLPLGPNTVSVIVTATDGDGDTDDSAPIDISGQFNFLDDGPDAVVLTQSVGTVVLDESRPVGTDNPDPMGNPFPGDNQATINLAANFATGVNVDYGADGPGTVGYTLLLSEDGIGSGMYAIEASDTVADADGIGQGAEITLVQTNATTITGSANGTPYFTIQIDPTTGVVTFTQLDNIWHPTPGTSYDENAVLNTLAASNLQAVQTVTDGDGDKDVAAVNIGRGVFIIQDDGPVAAVDSNTVANGSASGNVLTNDDVGEDMPGRVSLIDNGPAPGGALVVPAGGSVTIAGQYGSLEIFSNGNYVYTRTDGLGGGQSDQFTYTLIDADGDTITSTLTIAIPDATPSLDTPPALQLDDDNALTGNGNPDGPGDDPVSVPLGGTLVANGGDGDKDYFFNTAQTAPAGFTYNVVTGATTQTMTITQTSTGLVVATIMLTNETGAYTVVQNNPVQHDTLNGVVGQDDTENNTPNFNVSFIARDVDNDPSNAVNLVLNFDDDTPVLSNVAAGVGVTLDETTAVSITGFPQSVSSVDPVITATKAFGADGAAVANSIVYGLDLAGTNLTTLASGLQTAQGDFPITLRQVDGDTIVGEYTNGGTQLAFTIQMNSDGTITYTQNVPLEHLTDGSSAAAHDDSLNLAGKIDATITITDKDGDSTSASTPIGNLIVIKDDGPDAQLSTTPVGSVVLDESRPEGSDRGPGATEPTGTDSETINFGANFVTGPSVDYGADGAGSVSYAFVLSAASVGSGLYALEGADTTTTDLDGYGQGAEIMLSLSGNVISGKVGTTTYFTITLDPATGVATFTQFLNIWHPASGTASFDELQAITTAAASNIKVVQTVTDSDGDTDTAEINVGQGVFAIEDDGPQAIQPQEATVTNSAGQSDIDNPLDDDGSLLGDFGTDLPGKITFANITNGQDTAQKSGNVMIELFLSPDGQTLQGRTGATGYDTGGTLIYTVQIQGDGTYDFTLNAPIDNGSGASFANLSGGVAGNPPFKLIESSTADALELLVTPINTGTVNSDSDDIAAGSQFIEFDTGIRFDFGNFTYVPNSGGTDDDQWVINSNETINGFKFTIDQISNGTLVDIRLTAYDADTDGGVAEGAINTGDPAGDPVDPITMVKLYNTSGTLVGTFTADGVYSNNNGTPGNLTDDILVTIDFDTVVGSPTYGTVAFENLPSDYSIQTYTANGYSRLEVYNEGTASPDGKFSLSFLSIETTQQGNPIDLFFDVAITDADGDSVIVDDGIHINVDPVGAATTLAASTMAFSQEPVNDNSYSLMASDTMQKSYANNSVLLGAIAAAGLASVPAAANTVDGGGGEQLTMSLATFDASSTFIGGSEDRIDAMRSTFAGDTREALHIDTETSTWSSRGFDLAAEHTLTSGNEIREPLFNTLPGGTNIVEAQAFNNFTSTTVAMPSADMMTGLNLDNAKVLDVHHNAVVGQALVDALAGGANGPNLDAVIDAHANLVNGPGLGGAEAIATQPLAAVPAWDVATFADFSATHSTFTMEPMLHHDAVQTAA